MNARLERVHAAILAGAPEADVYALWRELAAPDVAAAEAPPRPARRPARPDARARRGRRPRGRRDRPSRGGAPPASAVHVAVALPAGAGGQLAALVHSLLEHASRPLHLWVLARPGERRARAARRPLPRARAELGAAARDPPEAAAAPAPGAAARRGPRRAPAAARRSRRATSPSSPALDLGGRAFAAPRRPGTNGISGFGVLHAAGNRLGDRPEVAAELRRTAHARHAFDFDAFTTGVLVADLVAPARRAAARRRRRVRARRPRDAALARRPRPRDRAGPLGVGADADARAGPGADPLGRRPEGKGVPERATYRRHARAARGDRQRATVPPASP